MLRSSFKACKIYNNKNNNNIISLSYFILFNNQNKYYSIDTPPEELQKNVPMLSQNIDMKNISLQVSGGRSSTSGIRATVFGASGKMGRYVVNQLGQIGSQVVIPYRRDGWEMKDLKLMGDLGQIVPVPYQIRDKRAVERAIEGSNVVINCLQAKRENRNFSFHDVHVNGTHMIARCSAELGVDRFIQVSHANCSEDNISNFLRTKWLGEQVARSFYPECTIIRPSIIYGYGDQFCEKMGKQWTHWRVFKRPKLVNGDQILQPCHFLDVARSIVACILDPLNTAGKTYSIYGNVRALRRHFFERVHECTLMYRTHKKLYRDWNPWLLYYFHKPYYKIFKNYQKIFDYFRVANINWEGISYEDVCMDLQNYYPDYNIDPTLLTMEDLGLQPEDYNYWEKKLLYPFFDRLGAKYHNIQMKASEKGWGSQVPSTDTPSWHSTSYYGYRNPKWGGYRRDWWVPDISEQEYDKMKKGVEEISYSSDIDGNDRLKQLAQRGKLN